MSTQPIPPDLKARLKDSYDAIAPQYNKTFTPISDPLRLKYLSTLLAELKPSTNPTSSPQKVLELGCGAGLPITKALLDHPSPTLHLTSNDLSSTQITLARENLAAYEEAARLDLVQGDMLALSFPPSTFTAVLAFYSIIHLPRSEQPLLLSKIHDWLEPGGLFLANFSAEDMEEGVVDEWLGLEKGWMFWSGWGVEGSVGMVEKAGFEILVREVSRDVVDADFVWVLARKKKEQVEIG
ncbi:methyltransferase domain-containing protein [Amniculicola lignicola CBS 123094]|uniref:Methyltransferase domain-containing protein n=1 Tax=Amniculicola lignicola CBS 123094 TaxID=1392246 RepID=A0A6A5WPB2_9PLEO|nr:methyltransferase domain-containing protein [Amniculicola lignicola CBS 123094]